MKTDGPVFGSAEIRCGKLRLRRSDLLAAQCRSLRDGEYELRIERRKATRSLQSNRFYWGVVIKALADYTGYSPNEVHEICKAKFLPKQAAICDRNGVVVDELVIGGSTAKLDPGEFTDYIEAIVTWAVQTLDMSFPELAV